jgi:heme/copper-type cytochrome/quinol oxidase subunit 2
MHFGPPEILEERINHYKAWVMLVLVGLVLLWAGWQWWRYRSREKRKRIAKQQAILREAASRQS